MSEQIDTALAEQGGAGQAPHGGYGARLLGLVARAVFIAAVMAGGYGVFHRLTSPTLRVLADLYQVRTPGVLGSYKPESAGTGFEVMQVKWMKDDPSTEGTPQPMATRHVVIPDGISKRDRNALVQALLQRAAPGAWRCTTGEPNCSMSMQDAEPLTVDRALAMLMAGTFLGPLGLMIGVLAVVMGMVLATRPVPLANVRTAAFEIFGAAMLLIVTVVPSYALAMLAAYPSA